MRGEGMIEAASKKHKTRRGASTGREGGEGWGKGGPEGQGVARLRNC